MDETEVVVTTARLDEAIRSLPDRHRRALDWFFNSAGRHVGWPKPLSDGTLLVCRPKGIYKPAWTDYALSVRESLDGEYPDEAPVGEADHGWVYRYFQESIDPATRDDQPTNRALVRNHADGIPVGVLIQVKRKPDPLYQVLGVGHVGQWEHGYFPIHELH